MRFSSFAHIATLFPQWVIDAIYNLKWKECLIGRVNISSDILELEKKCLKLNIDTDFEIIETA